MRRCVERGACFAVGFRYLDADRFGVIFATVSEAARKLGKLYREAASVAR